MKLPRIADSLRKSQFLAFQSSGISLRKDAQDKYEALTGKSSARPYDYVILTVNDEATHVIVKEVLERGEATKKYDEQASEFLAMTDSLKATSQPCWGACYFRFGDKLSKLVVIYW